MGNYFNTHGNNNVEDRNNDYYSTNRKRPNYSNNLASYFYIAGKKFEVLLDQCQPFLFGDRTDLNFIYTNKPVKYTFPSTSLNSVTKVLKCPINIRKDSLKLVKVTENNVSSISKYNLEFKIDCDVDITIEIYYFAKERFYNGTLSYTSTLVNTPYFKSQIYKIGSNISFNQAEHYVIPSNYEYINWQYDFSNQIYPIVILCTPVDPEFSTYSHITYATLEKLNDLDNYSIKLLKQKQVIDGFVIHSKKFMYVKSRRSSSIDIQQGVTECVICMCEKRDTLILPCRHLCLCKSCANNLRGQSNNCPICRIPFNALLQMETIKGNQAFIKTTDIKETIFEESQNLNSTDTYDQNNSKTYILNDKDDNSLSVSQEFEVDNSLLSSLENLANINQSVNIEYNSVRERSMPTGSMVVRTSIDELKN